VTGAWREALAAIEQGAGTNASSPDARPTVQPELALSLKTIVQPNGKLLGAAGGRPHSIEEAVTIRRQLDERADVFLPDPRAVDENKPVQSSDDLGRRAEGTGRDWQAAGKIYRQLADARPTCVPLRSWDGS